MSVAKLYFNDPKTLIEPAAFIVISVFAGSSRLIKYFPGATKGGLLLTGSMAGAFCTLHDYYYSRKDSLFLNKISALILSSIVSGCLTYSLKGRVALSFSNNLKIISMGSVVVFFKSFLLSSKPELKESEDSASSF